MDRFGKSVRRLQFVVLRIVCMSAVAFAANGQPAAAEPQPGASSVQTKTQLLIETQKRLDSPDPAIRYPAYDAALSSDDAVLRNLALSKGMASNDAAVRSMALASIFARLKSLSVEIVPSEAVAKELEAAKQNTDNQRVSNEALQTVQFLQTFGSVITVNILAYDAKSQSFVGVVPDHVEAERIKNKDYSVGSLSGEVLQLSAKLQRPGGEYSYTPYRVICQMNLALKQGGIMSGPLGCTGNFTLPRATGRLRVF